MRKKFSTLAFASILFTGCVHVPEQKIEGITFQAAMKQLAEGLNEFDDTSQEGEEIFGLVPSEVEANFNISLINKGTNETTIAVDPTNVLKEVSSFGSSWKYEGSETRGNTITVKFRNVLFSKKGEAVYDKENIAALIKALRDAGIGINYIDLDSGADH